MISPPAGPQVDLDTGSARAALGRRVLATQNGHAMSIEAPVR